MKIKHLLVGMLAIVAAVACKQDEPVVEPVLNVDKNEVALANKNAEATFSVTSNNAWALSADQDWVSFNPTSSKASEKAVKVVVTAEDNTAEQARVATITVKSGDLSKTVKVTQAAADPKADRALAFSTATATATIGNEFTAPVLSGETAGVVYSSSNVEVATVDSETGVVTLVAAGETTITATAEATETLLAGTASYTLTVVTKTDRALAFSAATATATIGNEFTAPVLSGETAGVVYSSSNTSVATVDAATGAVTLVAAGETTITATAEATETLSAGTASYTLTVVAKSDRALAFSATAVEATLGEGFTAPVLSGETAGVVYSSSNTSVATVDAATGAVTLVAAGETTITAAAEANETHLAGSASYTLTVVEPALPAGIANIKSLASTAGTAFKVMLEDAVVTYVSGNNAYVQDANDGILIFVSGHGLATGDKINGEVSGTVKYYNNLREITAINLTKAEKQAGAEIPVTVLTIAELNAAGAYDKYENMRIKVCNAEMTTDAMMSQDGQTYAIYKKVTSVKGFDQYNYVDVVGYPGKYNENVQFNVFENATVLGASKTLFSGLEDIQLGVGDTKANKAVASSGATVTYVSASEAIATVDQEGNVTGVAEGETTITVSVPAYNNYPAAEATCKVKVVAAGTVVETVTATITFDNTSKRKTFTTSQQVWQENGITVTNDKSSSTSNVADYYKPARFYKSSKLTVAVDAGLITKIVFDCNSTSYANDLKTSIGATATASSDKVTVTLDNPAASFVIATLAGQVRMDAISVTYQQN